VASLRKPGGNITGFINMEASLSGKWVELIHEIAPLSRAWRSCLIHKPLPLLNIIWIRSDPLRRHFQ
jgi:putative ABC transport system substrate-binding protein